MKKSAVFTLSLLILIISAMLIYNHQKINSFAVKKIPKCSDSDYGDEPFIKGIVTYESPFRTIIYRDKCINKNLLREYFCSKNSVKTKNYKCDNGCENASCKYPFTENKNVLFIIDSSLSQNITYELNLFKKQLEKEYGWKIQQKEFSPDVDKKQIKDYLINFYKSNGLEGVYLIGIIPTGEFSYGYESILSDYYYQDIYEDCKETNLTVKWECYDPKKDINLTLSYPCEQSGMITIREIIETLLSFEPPCASPYETSPFFISRITSNSDDDNTELIKRYFINNINYRTSNKTFSHQALIYIPIYDEVLDAGYRLLEIEELKNYLTGKYKNFQAEGAYTDSQIVIIDQEQANSDELFLEESKKDYDYFFYEGHGDPSNMQKSLIPEEVKNTSLLLGTFFSCSVGRFTEKNYIAGEFIFKGKMLYTDAASASVGRSMSPSVGFFNYLLTRGIPIFETLAVTGRQGGALNNLGDVSIKLSEKASYYSDNSAKIYAPETIDFGEVSNGTRTSISFNLKNDGFSDLVVYDISLFFERKDKDHKIYDLPWAITSNLFRLSPNNSKELTLEIEPTAFSEGEYFGKLMIISNDPVYPIKEISFKVIVI